MHTSNRRLYSNKGILVLAAGLLLPGGLAAQVICAAPHSAPSLRPSGTIGTIEPLTGWVQFTYFRQRSTEFYNHLGDLQPLLANTAITTNSVFVTSGFGITEGLEVWAQVPIHDLSSTSAAGDADRRGMGDPRFAVRVGSELLGLSFPLMVRAGVKFAGTSFPIDATIIPLSEGQTDWEVSLESGYYLSGAFPLQVVGSFGYRWRQLNVDSGRKPGSERFAYLFVGGPQRGWRWSVAFEGLWGDAPEEHGFRLPASKRKLIRLGPSIAYQMGGNEVQVAMTLPLLGRNLAAARAITIGFYMPWALP